MRHLVRAAVCALLFAGVPVLGEEKKPPSAGGWRPFDLGTHHRAVSTKSKEAQQAFDQGLIWAFAFNHDEAERAFREAARRDPKLAIAWWGISLVNGPHINNPIVDEPHAKAAWVALGEARRRLDGASEVEKALIGALGSRYALPQPEDRHRLDEAYAKAMGDVYRRFPKDVDVATLRAEALMDVRPWDQWTKEGQPEPGTKEILEALEAAVKLSPDHPGALHLTIHALETSPHPERAKSAADRLRRLVPDASHLVHMPAHIDARLGRWADAALANERAIDADRRYRARAPELGFYNIYIAHNAHFLAYTAMMEGRKAVALEKTAEAIKTFPIEYWHFVRGIANAALGNVEAAEKERAIFTDGLMRVPKEFFWGSNNALAVLGVGQPYLEGEILYRQGRLDEAIARLREAVSREDALTCDEPPGWTVPSRHALGAVLLEAKKWADAEAVYREDLAKYPENGWSLLGLSRVLAGAGRKAEADAVRVRFRKSWERADIELTSSCLCVKEARVDAPVAFPGSR